MKLQKKHLLEIRDIINEMEENLDYYENAVLCTKRISDILERVIFDEE